ncbi:MAG: ribonuclease P protein component [Pseudomonadota bacterium]
MSKSNTKVKSKIQEIFDKGTKFVSKSFVAFFLFSDRFEPIVIASKKVGNAVKRNRCKRRLREISRLYLKKYNIKLILIARGETSILDFSVLLRDCNNLIKKIEKS